ncbi:MAG TPA: hypothetical protein VHZ55_04355 [Bryobacteraceae bacterium]|nr:hypothetical protein [Bryobacteraceae bacterium]
MLAQYSILFYADIQSHFAAADSSNRHHDQVKGIESFHYLLIVSSQFKARLRHASDSSFRAIRDQDRGLVLSEGGVVSILEAR